VNAEQLAQIALLGEAVECMGEVAIFVWDEDRNYIAANDAAVELTGRSRDEILRMKVGDMTPDRAAPHFEDVQRGDSHRGGLRIDRADGPVDIDWVTCRTKIAGLPYMISICWRRDAP
jgi:PAS domain-containing protein